MRSSMYLVTWLKKLEKDHYRTQFVPDGIPVDQSAQVMAMDACHSMTLAICATICIQACRVNVREHVHVSALT